jgi:hypothetical protein
MKKNFERSTNSSTDLEHTSVHLTRRGLSVAHEDTAQIGTSDLFVGRTSGSGCGDTSCQLMPLTRTRHTDTQHQHLLIAVQVSLITTAAATAAPNSVLAPYASHHCLPLPHEPTSILVPNTSQRCTSLRHTPASDLAPYTPLLSLNLPASDLAPYTPSSLHRQKTSSTTPHELQGQGRGLQVQPVREVLRGGSWEAGADLGDAYHAQGRALQILLAMSSTRLYPTR